MPSESVKRSDFLVTSHGWSASHWLAYSLNLHPQISCVHSSAAILADDPCSYQVESALEAGDFGGVYAKLWAIRQGYQQRTQRAPRELLHTLEMEYSSPVIGAVHTYRLRDLAKHIASPVGVKEPLSQPIRVANLLRHPITLVNSGYGQFRLSFRLDLLDLQWALSKLVQHDAQAIEHISVQHQTYPGDFNNLCFACACLAFQGIAEDCTALQQIEASPDYQYLGQMRKEDITLDPDQLLAWIERLSAGRIEVSPDYLQRVFSGGRVNAHNADNSCDDPEQVYQSWSPWQRAVFFHYLEYFQLRTFYTQVGYQVPECPNQAFDREA